MIFLCERIVPCNTIKYNTVSLGESIGTKYAEQRSWKVASFGLQLPPVFSTCNENKSSFAVFHLYRIGHPRGERPVAYLRGNSNFLNLYIDQ